MSATATRRVQQRTVETRDRLVDAALHEFAAKGFDGASTRAIATRAGVAQSALPYHFTTKDALWRAAVDRIFEAFAERFTARIAGLDGVDAQTRLKLLFGDFLRFSAERPALHRFMVQEGSAPSERLEWLVTTHLQPVIDGFRAMAVELEAEGWVMPGRFDHMFYMLIGAAAMPYAVAAEFELTMHCDPFEPEMIDRHVEAMTAVFFPPRRGVEEQES